MTTDPRQALLDALTVERFGITPKPKPKPETRPDPDAAERPRSHRTRPVPAQEDRMTDQTTTATIYGASDDLIEFDGAIYGEAGLNLSTGVSSVTLKAPDGTRMKLRAEFCQAGHPDGWKVYVVDNPGVWDWRPFDSLKDEDGHDIGVKVDVPEGTTAKCDGKRVR